MEKLEASVVIEHIESDKSGNQTGMYKMYFNVPYMCRIIKYQFELNHAFING